MTNISTGKVSGKGKSRITVHAVSGSTTAVDLGAVSGEGTLNLLVFDHEHGYESAKLEAQLSTLQDNIVGNSDADRKARQDVGVAKAALAEGDHSTVAHALKSAGSIALSVAKSVGIAVAEKAIEASLGLAG